jgi:hypothetical protein
MATSLLSTSGTLAYTRSVEVSARRNSTVLVPEAMSEPVSIYRAVMVPAKGVVTLSKDCISFN